ncbi:MAG: histidine phosphatase family protein [Bifidobacteriaceae bacterium]|jgi:phosphohistidine phosphatase|nr:histidine phosphatase family protein [Bifidobacteriaceae bacterium]
MTRTLLLVRHAKAGHGDESSDAKRSLTELGYEQCRILGRELCSLKLEPDVALVSTARRARQTYNALAAAASWDLDATLVEPLYTGYVPEVLDAVHTVPDSATVAMVVGHEPTMSAAAYSLASTGSDPDTVTRVRRGMPTAGMAVIQVDGPWESVGFEPTLLRWLLTPLA